MKKPIFYLLFICLALLAQLVWANTKLPVTLKRLQEVNCEWQNQPEAAQLNLTGVPSADEREILRTHLRLVEHALRQRPVNNLTKRQRQNRTRHLNNLHDYWQSEGLPVNTTHTYRLPIFIDEQDNFCAVGHLLKASGNEQAAREIAVTQRYAYLSEIQHPALKMWASESGLTLEELAWIQPTYPDSVNANRLDGGTDGSVYALEYDQATGALYAAGKFSTAGGATGINNIGAWMPGFAGYFWMPLGSGLGTFQSPVRTLCMYHGELYAGGNDLLPTGASNGVARWDGSQWGTPGPLGGTVSKLFVWRDSLYAAVIENISVPPTPITRLYCLTPNSWHPRGLFNGAILDAIPYQNDLVLGGEFTVANGVNTQFIARYNGNQFSPMGTGVELPVRALEVHKDTLYAGGDFYSPLDTTKSFGLAHWNGNSWQNEFSGAGSMNLNSDARINDLLSTPGQLLAGGNFYAWDWTVSGRGIAAFRRSAMSVGYNVLHPLAAMDSSVYALAQFGQELIMGGNFESIYGTVPDPHHIAGINIAGFLSAEPVITHSPSMDVFPNPTEGEINISVPAGADHLTLFDLCGKQLNNQTITGKASFQLTGLAPGMYVIKATCKGKPIGIQRIVKH